jgi:hypothetical protein
MPKVKYVGPIDEVEVIGVGVFARHSDPVEVDAATAKALLAQPDNFEAVTEKKKG